MYTFFFLTFFLFILADVYGNNWVNYVYSHVYTGAKDFSLVEALWYDLSELEVLEVV